MSEFKSMKIAITHEQPFDEIMVELERLGYVNRAGKSRHFVYTEVLHGSDVLGIKDQGYILSTNVSYILDDHTRTTLSELKRLK